MSTDNEQFLVQLKEFDTIADLTGKLLKTQHYAKMGVEGIHTILSRAKALGIHPFEALNGGFYFVSGRVGMSTEMMAALVRKAGHSIQKDPKSNAEICILHGKRADNGDTWTCTFSKDDAIAAGLWGGATWKKYPSVMLYNRCMSMLFRQLFPDISLGAGYVEDELAEITKTGDYAKEQKLEQAEVEVVQPKKEIISEDQTVEFIEFLSMCDPEYIKKIDEYLKRRGIVSKFDITTDIYPDLLQKVKLKAAEHQNQLAEKAHAEVSNADNG